MSHPERGASLIEILLVLLLVGVAVATAASYSISWLSAEEARSAVYQTQMFMQLARVESITRNRSCRFEIDGSTRKIRVVDLNDPFDATDDLTIADAQLSSRVGFADPGGGAAITLSALTGEKYQATFASDGSVSSGAGAIALQGKELFERVALYAAGGTRVERWIGGTWQPRP